VIGVALLGAGFMARTHAAVYAGAGDRAQVRVVCARSAEDARPLAESLGADVVTDWDAAIGAAGVDAVDICLPTPLHRPVAERALATGRHVLLEKPVALTLEDADAIGAAVAAGDVLLMVGHVLRYLPEVVELRRVLATEELGRPLAATALRLSTPPDWNEWMLDADHSGGTLVDLMVHDFDLMNALLGPAQRVHARAAAGGRHVMALVEHEGGDAAVEGSHAMPSSFPFTAGLRVLCRRGVLEHRFEARADDEGGNIGGGVSSALRVHPAGGEAREFAGGGNPWGAQIERFLDCVEAGVEPEDGTLAQARAALAVALAARASLVTGQPEPVSPS
jgi:predicted dehydrogenase